MQILNRWSSVLLGVVILALAQITSAHAIPIGSSVIANTFGPGDTFGPGGWTIGFLPGSGLNEQVAARFKLPYHGLITEVDVAAFAPTVRGKPFLAPLVLQIRADNAGMPGALTGLTSVAFIPSNPNINIFTFLVSRELDEGNYWLTMRTNAQAPAPYFGAWEFNNIALIGVATSLDGAATWSKFADAPRPAYRIAAKQIPEPSTLSLFLGALLIIGCARFVCAREQVRNLL
jgi:hypothetical protein